MILVNPFKRTMSDLDRRLLLVRRAHPELGRLKLALVLISNWPLLAMAILARGSSIVRMGAWLPSVLICASVAGGLLSGKNPELDKLIFTVAFAMAIIGTWALLGVILAIFNMPLAQGMLSEIEQLAQGFVRGKLNAGTICQRHAEHAKTESRLDDYQFFLGASQKIAMIEQGEAEEMKSIANTIRFLRRELATTSEIVRVECLIRRFSQTVMMFFATIFAFALISEMLSKTPGAFSPNEHLDFLSAIYFSFTTVTTTDYGDITPASHLARMVAVWEQCFGVAFMTVIIGIIVDNAKRGTSDSDMALSANPGRREGRTRRRILAFALRLLRDYNELSEPRREIDEILDAVEDRVAILKGKPRVKEG